MCETDYETQERKDQSLGLFYSKGHIHHIKDDTDQKVYKQILIHHMHPLLE